MAAQPIEPAIAALLETAARDAARFSLRPLVSGGNNRVFEVQCDGKRFVAKWYFHDAQDSRDRARSEFLFLQHASSLGLRCVPRALACDRASHVALYEYVDGRRLHADEIDEARVGQAAAFFAALNDPASRQRAAGLPAASESCFSITEHLAMVDARLARLAAISERSSVDREATAFLRELHAAWQREKGRLLRACAKPEEPLPAGWRCLSPSDFGFHNALLRADGSLCFLDFEYAGWDDPAKAFGDFFAHPGVPVPQIYRERFIAEAAAPFQDPVALAERARLLAPVFRMKWCCIVLNEFLPEAAARRRFADPVGNLEERKSRQLVKARGIFSTLNA